MRLRKYLPVSEKQRGTLSWPQFAVGRRGVGDAGPCGSRGRDGNPRCQRQRYLICGTAECFRRPLRAHADRVEPRRPIRGCVRELHGNLNIGSTRLGSNFDGGTQERMIENHAYICATQVCSCKNHNVAKPGGRLAVGELNLIERRKRRKQASLRRHSLIARPSCEYWERGPLRLHTFDEGHRNFVSDGKTVLGNEAGPELRYLLQ